MLVRLGGNRPNYSRIRRVASPPGIDVHARFFPESFFALIEREGGPDGASVAMGYERPRDIIGDRAAGLSRADQARVLRSNAARLLRLR